MRPFLNILFLLLIGFQSHYSFTQHSPVFPEPLNISYTEGTFVIPEVITFGVNEVDMRMLPTVPNSLVNLKYPESFRYAENNPVLVYQRKEGLKREGYEIDISSERITIEYSENQGAYYGQLTLAQILENKKPGETLRCMSISDEPAFAYRGVHLDCARHFFTIAEIKGFLDEIARLKFNKFHWHLTDDQGWRIEIKKYPKLTEMGAWRDSTLIGHFSTNPQVYEKKHYGGFYTQAQAKEIVEYAKGLGIEVIPEIEMPGHARAAMHAYPELGCTGEQLPVEGLWGVFDDIFCSKNETRQFLKDVLDEVMAIFPSNVIHIGGDEAPKVRWDVCPQCAKVKTEHGLHDSHELQSFFIQDIENHVRSKGKTIIGWDEILEGGLAKNAQVMSWRGEEGGIAAAKQGHEVVMTPTAYCYLDYYQSGDPGEPLAIGGYLPLEKVYSFYPVPKELSENERKFILGGQANFWTEYLPEMKDVQYNAFPRLVAMAEVLWTGKVVEYSDFVNSLMEHYLPDLEARGINFSRSFLYPKLSPEPFDGGIEYTVEYPVESENQLEKKIALNRTSSKHTVNAEILISKDLQGKDVVRNYTFTSHSLVGIPVKFITEPNSKFNNHGNLALTDGIIGARPWKGDQWLGFSTDTVQFIVDLGSYKTLGTMELRTLNDPGSWIYSPKKIIVDGSKDGNSFRKLSEQKIDGELVSVEFESKARFLKITLINDELIPAGNSGAGNTPWTFIDEIILKP